MEKRNRTVLIVDDPLVYAPARMRMELGGEVMAAPLGAGYFEAPLPRPRRDPPGPTPAQRKAKRATRKAERQRRKAGRRGGR